jgi:hypothetical protein
MGKDYGMTLERSTLGVPMCVTGIFGTANGILDFHDRIEKITSKNQMV